MNNYLENDNTLNSNFRSIYLFGRNVATYKFAFAKTLLELGKASTLDGVKQCFLNRE